MSENELKAAIVLQKCEFALKINVTETIVIYYDDESTTIPMCRTKFDKMSECINITPFCSLTLTN